MNALTEAKKIRKKIVAWRRHIHQHPELSFRETETQKFIAARLREFGLTVNTRVAGAAVLADLTIPGAQRRIAFRADMDALPVVEESGLPFASRNEGLAHVCGHDAHMAMVLGAACILSAGRDSLDVNARFIFQPGEECPPGMAKDVVAAGALDDVDEIYGLHIHPGLEVGEIATRSGPLMGSADDFSVVVTGRGGHGGIPDRTADPVVAAAEIVMALQTLVSRRTSPVDSAVVSVCTLEAGNTFNVIPETARLRGTIRALAKSTRRRLVADLKRVAKGVARAHGAAAQVSLKAGYPAVVNHKHSVERIARAIDEDLAGALKLIDIGPLMVGEDFSYYLQETEGAFAWIGAKPSGGGDHAGHHNSRFRLNEDALPLGTALFVQLALG